MGVIRNIIKNELYLIGLLLIQELLRFLMKANKEMSTDIKQSIILIILVAILSVLQQIIKVKHNNSENVKK